MDDKVWYRFAIIENAIAIISFCAMACYFHKWWLSLFALLFLWVRSSKKETEGKNDEN